MSNTKYASIIFKYFTCKTVALLALVAVMYTGQRYSNVNYASRGTPREGTIKYILLWTSADWAPFYYLGEGQTKFIENKCPYTNCFITSNRNYLKDVRRFHAIAFNGRNLQQVDKSLLPKTRSVHQKYIYFNTESHANVPLNNKIFDDFFNWTATYKLNSDIPFPYIEIRNKRGEIIGPRANMKWEEKYEELDDDFIKILSKKTKAAAWFVSNCNSKSRRKEFVEKLQKALKKYNLDVDIYGDCGQFQCPRDRQPECNQMLQERYYFYLSLENSFSQDYVTEKLLTAVQNKVVPIVFGGADYSRFLPPGSYVDGRSHPPAHLAALMHRLITSPRQYRHYFNWTTAYSYHDPMRSTNVCNLCDALNDNRKMKTTHYRQLRRWWNS